MRMKQRLARAAGVLLALAALTVAGAALAEDEAEQDCQAPQTIDMEQQPLFLGVSHFAGVAAADFPLISETLVVEFLPHWMELDGYVNTLILNGGVVGAEAESGDVQIYQYYTSADSLAPADEQTERLAGELLAAQLPQAPAFTHAEARLLQYALGCGAQREIFAFSDGLYIGARHYEGVNPDDFDEVTRISRDFMDIISAAPGFRLWGIAAADDGALFALNIFESEAEMLAANQQVAEFIGERLAALIPNAPTSYGGDLTAFTFPDFTTLAAPATADGAEDEQAPEAASDAGSEAGSDAGSEDAGEGETSSSAGDD